MAGRKAFGGLGAGQQGRDLAALAWHGAGPGPDAAEERVWTPCAEAVTNRMTLVQEETG